MSDYRKRIRQRIQPPDSERWDEIVMLFYKALHAYQALLAYEKEQRETVEPAEKKRTNYNRTKTGICLLEKGQQRPPVRTETRETMRPPLWAA